MPLDRSRFTAIIKPCWTSNLTSSAASRPSLWSPPARERTWRSRCASLSRTRRTSFPWWLARTMNRPTRFSARSSMARTIGTGAIPASARTRLPRKRSFGCGATWRPMARFPLTARSCSLRVSAVAVGGRWQRRKASRRALARSARGGWGCKVKTNFTKLPPWQRGFFV